MLYDTETYGLTVNHQCGMRDELKRNVLRSSGFRCLHLYFLNLTKKKVNITKKGNNLMM